MARARIGRRGLAIPLAVVVALVGAGTAIPAGAGMVPINDDIDLYREVDEFKKAMPTGQSIAGRGFMNDPFRNSSKLWAILEGETCPAIDRGLCAETNLVSMNIVFPHCDQKRKSHCVESVYTRDGRRIEALPAGSFRPDDASSIPSFKLFDGTVVPAGGNLALFRLPQAPHTAGDTYGLSVSLSTLLGRTPQGWVPQPMDLEAHLVPVSLVPYDESDPACMDPDDVSSGSCIVTSHRLPDTRFGASVRVGASFGAWVFGRVADLSIDISPTVGGNLLVLEGRPASTPEAIGLAYCEPGAKFLNQICPYLPQVWTSSSGTPNSFAAWRNWAPYVGPRSDAIVRRWSFASNGATGSTFSGCLEAGEVSGWISTNAMVFEAVPPTWNGRSLDFGVAGPPLTPDGERASGDYEFFLRSSVAECLWKGRNVAKQATVQVIDAGASSEVTTTSVGESKGWVRFVARNFGFPNVPTVRSSKAPKVKIPKISIRMKAKKR